MFMEGCSPGRHGQDADTSGYFARREQPGWMVDNTVADSYHFPTGPKMWQCSRPCRRGSALQRWQMPALSR